MSNLENSTLRSSTKANGRWRETKISSTTTRIFLLDLHSTRTSNSTSSALTYASEKEGIISQRGLPIWRSKSITSMTCILSSTWRPSIIAERKCSWRLQNTPRQIIASFDTSSKWQSTADWLRMEQRADPIWESCMATLTPNGWQSLWRNSEVEHITCSTGSSSLLDTLQTIIASSIDIRRGKSTTKETSTWEPTSKG